MWYANRAKSITNKPHINEDPKDALLREYQEKIMRLKSLLEKRKKKEGGEGAKRRRKPSGEFVSDDEDEDGVTAKVTIKMKHAELEEQKKALLQNKEILDEERERLLSEVQRREEVLKKEQKKRDQLASKIKAMEGKLLAGNVEDRTDEAKKALEQKNKEVIEQRIREREILRQLEEKEESTLEVKETYTSLQEEVESKTKKLNKLKSKLNAAWAEMTDYKEEQTRVREELTLTLASLQRERKLRKLIIENFIPPEDAEKVITRAVYAEEEEDWLLQPHKAPSSNNDVMPRPLSSKTYLHPVSAYAKISANKGDPRYMPDNILKVELDLPNRTTRDYEAPTVASSLQAALDAALQNEEEMMFDATSFTLSEVVSKPQRPSRPKGRGNSKELKEEDSHHHHHTSTGQGQGVSSGSGAVGVKKVADPEKIDREIFPTSRGLVSRPVRFA